MTHRLFLMNLSLTCAVTLAAADGALPLDFEHLAALQSVREIAMSPDGKRVAYGLELPRRPGVDEDGPAYRALHLVTVEDGADRAYVHGEVNVSAVSFTPDGKFVTYLAKREGDEHKGLWAVPVDGGESVRLVEHDQDLQSYRVSPDGRRVAFVAYPERDEAWEASRDQGYKQEVFEEDWRPRRLWVVSLPGTADLRPAPHDPTVEPEEDEPGVPLELSGSVFDVRWLPDGERLAVTVAPTPLIDDQYMRRRVRIVDAATGATFARVTNPGKLGEFEVSADGRWIAMVSAADPNDPREGRLMVGPTEGGEPRDLMPGFEGHVSSIAWRDRDTVLFTADVGVETIVGEVSIGGGVRTLHAKSGPGSPVTVAISVSSDGTRAALIGESADHPREVYVLVLGAPAPRRLTRHNPWLDRLQLAEQEVLRWKARDGLELEGLLLRPIAPTASPAPLLLMVHGGPEAQDRNGWVTSYSRPGQLAAGRGYFVLYPNYRGSTGRGIEFSKLGQGDAAGAEFDDLIDAIDHLVAAGRVDRDRVGILGGSYGGYATAWCSTRYSDRFRAGAMFVGISNKVSKGLTTEIPYEDEMVHTRYEPWTRWQFSLERSPIYHAEQSRTALLIAGGTDDKRVHPSQSLQLYRALKQIGKTPVRYVRYPGEGHGNRKAAARDDYARRVMRWMDHFVAERGAGLPPWQLPLPETADADDGADESED